MQKPIEVRGMLPKFDFHVHTLYSDGTRTPAGMVEAAEARGLEAVAITDHGPELSVGISPAKIAPMLADVEAAKGDAEIPVLAGMEANIIDPSGAMDLDDQLVERLDILVAGVHRISSSVHEPRELARVYLETATNAMRRGQMDVFAHPFQFHGDLSSHLSPDDIDEFARAAAESGAAIELNTKYHVPDLQVLSACMKEGVKFSMGTDAHTPPEVGDVGWQVAMLKRAGAKREDLILDRFL